MYQGLRPRRGAFPASRRRAFDIHERCSDLKIISKICVRLFPAGRLSQGANGGCPLVSHPRKVSFVE